MMRAACAIASLCVACSASGRFFSGSGDDDGSGSSTATDAGTSTDGGSAIAPNVAFMTSTSFTLGSLGGGDGATAACGTVANANGLAGTYVAWISDSKTSAVERIGTASGWVRVDGQPLANSIADLVTGNFWYPLDVDELGHIDVAQFVWTGTVNGSAADNCSDYTDATGTIMSGYQVSAGVAWDTYATTGCGDPAPIYCFGIDRAAAVTITPPASSRLAFTTKSTFVASGGLTGADALCASEASGAGRSGKFAAFLPTSTQPAIARFDTTKAPWVRTDGVPVGDLISDPNMWIGLPIFAADGSRNDQVNYWGRPGTTLYPASQTCNDWSSGTAADTGVTTAVYEAEYGDDACNANTYHLFCLEQ